MHEMVTGARNPAVRGESGAGAGVEKSDGVVSIKLGSISRVARTNDGSSTLIERIRDAQARRHVVPRKRRLVPGKRETRHQIRKRLIRSSRAWERLAPLMVIANPSSDRHPAARHSVTSVEIEIAGPIGTGPFAIYASLKISRGVLKGQNHVSRVQIPVGGVRPTITPPIFQVMCDAHSSEECFRIDHGRLLRPSELPLVDRTKRLRRREASSGLYV